MNEPDYAPFARTYHLEYGALTEDIPFYVDLARRTGGPILEMAVGTGRIALPIAREGIPVVGFDSCPAMLEVLATRMREEPDLPVEWAEADMRTFDLVDRGPFAAVIVPGRAFLHCATVEDQLACLERVRRHLAPDGVFAGNFFYPDLGLIERWSRGSSIWEHGFEYPDPEDGHRVLVSHRNHHTTETQSIRAEMRYEHLSDSGEIFRTQIREHSLCWIWPRELEHLLARAGFEVEALFGDFDGTPYPAAAREIFWVARARRS